jgi:hypothetical protein
MQTIRAVCYVYSRLRLACCARDERRAILGQARKIYAGYEAYARHITDREIPIMILTG